VLDETGQFAGEGQSGHVWFLAGTIFGGTFERDVTVPTGTSLFFPALNAIFWAPDDLDDAAFFAAQNGLNPALMTDEELIRYIVRLAVNEPALLKVTVDGKELNDLTSYRAASDEFELTDTDLSTPWRGRSATRTWRWPTATGSCSTRCRLASTPSGSSRQSTGGRSRGSRRT
jgi:hypothetical protein